MHPLAAQDPTPEPAAPEPPALQTCPEGTGATLDGYVIDLITRIPLPGAEIEAAFDGRLFVTRADERGRFRFCALPAAGRPSLRATFRAVSSAPRSVVVTGREEPVALEIDLGEPADVVVSVTAADTGEPIEDVTVRLQPSVIGGLTNAEGRLGLGRVPPGEYRLRADHVAFHGGEGEVFIVPDRPRRLDVKLRRRIIALDTLNVLIEAGLCARPGYTTVSGKVIDRDTEIPIEGALVSASRFEDRSLEEQRTQTGEDGTFLLCGLPEGDRFRLAASVGSLQSEGTVGRAGEERGAIVLEIDHGDPGIVALRVVDDATGAPVEGAMIRLDPHPLGGLTNEDGRAGFRAIPPGEYSVRVEHIAYASFDGTMRVDDRSAEEYEVRMRPTAIAVEPLEVTITGRDPVLLETGFYDRMAELEEGYFYDYWDMEPYAMLSTFVSYKTWVKGQDAIFVNGRSITRLNQRVDEIPFGQVRGVEHLRCEDLGPEYLRQLDIWFRSDRDCWAVLIWRGERRVRSEREKPTDRCADERREETTCRNESGS